MNVATSLPKLFSYDGPTLDGAGYRLYQHLATSDWCEDDRAYLEALWTRFSALGLADPRFLERFRRECPARIWEMRLPCLFDDWNFRLVPSPKRGAGMDFGLELRNGVTCWIEATMPEPGTGPDRLVAPDDQLLDLKAVSHATALRYLKAIDSKRAQYRKAVKARRVRRQDCLMIAINGGQLRLADWEKPGELPLIVQIMFGHDDSAFSIDMSTGRIERVPRSRRSFRRHNGEEARAALFLSREVEEVSAVLFDPHLLSRHEVHGGKPGHDLVVVHNPFARQPLPVGQMLNGREFFFELTSVDHRQSGPRRNSR